MKPRPRKRTRSRVAACDGDWVTDSRVTRAVLVTWLMTPPAVVSRSATRSVNGRSPSSMNGASTVPRILPSRSTVGETSAWMPSMKMSTVFVGVNPAPSTLTGSVWSSCAAT